MAGDIGTARLTVISAMMLLCGIALQGCNVAVPRHSLGNWETKANYLMDFQYNRPGLQQKDAFLNSCSDPAAVASLLCSGHGKCRDWNDLAPGTAPKAKRLTFCECDRDYADPECRTPRKSQVTSFLLAMFFGMFGADQFYLGFLWYGILKLLFVGIIGTWCALRISWSDKTTTFNTKCAFLGLAIFWYLYDICRTGSSTVLTARNFRVAADLSHFTFVLSAVSAMLFIGFAIAIKSIQDHRKGKAHELLLLRLDQQESKEEELRPPGGWMPSDPQPFTGYGSTVSGGKPETRLGLSRQPSWQPPSQFVGGPPTIIAGRPSMTPPGTTPLGSVVAPPMTPPPTLPPASRVLAPPMAPVTMPFGSHYGGAPPPTMLVPTPSNLGVSSPAAQSPRGSALLPQVKGLPASANSPISQQPALLPSLALSQLPAPLQALSAGPATLINAPPPAVSTGPPTMVLTGPTTMVSGMPEWVASVRASDQWEATSSPQGRSMVGNF